MFLGFNARTIRPKMSWRIVLCLALVSAHMDGLARPQNPGATEPVHGGSALLSEARHLVQSGKPQAALSLLDRADVAAADAGEIHAIRGICLAMVGQPVESAAEFDQAIALHPRDAAIYFSSGVAFAGFDNLSRALDRLRTALQLDPRLPGLRYDYALVLARAGQYGESEKQVDAEIASGQPKAESVLELWKLKARDAYSQRKWTETIRAYRKVLSLQPGFAEGYAATGEALLSLNRPEQSAIALRQALSLDPQNGNAHKLLGRIYQDGAMEDRAVAEFETANRLNPGDRDVMYRLFRIYNKRGEKEKALHLRQQIEKSLRNDKAQAEDELKAIELNNDGMDLERKGDLDHALDDYDRASQADAMNLIFRRNAALLLCRMGRTQEAIQRLQDALSLDPDDAETLQILAVARELASGKAATRQLPGPKASHF